MRGGLLMKLSKDRRHFLLKKIIEEHEVEKQEQLVELLNEQGLEVTQATVSRDIKELNLAKVPTSSGNLKYIVMMNKNLNTQYQKLQRKIQEVVEKIDCVDHLIVIRTLPGNAHVIGALLDEMQWEEMLGCVCGNDTCLIITRTVEDREQLYMRLLKKS